MQTNNPTVGTFTRSIRLIMIIGFACAALVGCAYLMYSHALPAFAYPGLQARQAMADKQGRTERNTSSDDSGAIHLGPHIAEPTKETHFITITTMEIIHDDVVSKQKATQARKLFMELQPNPNFQKALENPKARANIDRLLNHPEIEKKLNGWFASLIRAAIHSKVNEPDFVELVAQPNYVDDLFKEYGIA